MEGWTEEEFENKDLMAPCGLYCGACGVYIATRNRNEKFRAVMGSLYGTKPEETECLGCMQPDPPKKLYGYCKGCTIRNCVKSKEYRSCYQCEEWPCSRIENFGFGTGMRVMKRGASNGRGQNVSVITVLRVACRFSEVPNGADHARDP